jgi:hypothetical protein
LAVAINATRGDFDNVFSQWIDWLKVWRRLQNHIDRLGGAALQQDQQDRWQ